VAESISLEDKTRVRFPRSLPIYRVEKREKGGKWELVGEFEGYEEAWNQMQEWNKKPKFWGERRKTVFRIVGP
jgi:hypothetical protein